MCRAIINFFLGVITVALLVVTIVLSVFYFSFTNPDFHKQNILDSGLYSFAANRIEQYVNSTALPGGLDPQTTEELVEGIPELILREFKADKLQIITENNINNFSDYLNGRSVSMVVYIPVSRVRDLVPDIFEQIRMNLSKIIAERPVCAEGEEPDESFSCVPADAKEQGVDKLLPEEFSNEDRILEILNANFPLVTAAEDNFTIQELGAAFNYPQSDTEEMVTTFARAKDLYDTSRVVIVCVWAINVALILLFVITLPKGFRSKISKVVFWVILVGLGIFLSGIASALLSGWVVNSLSVQGGPGEYLVGLDNVMTAFMNITFSRIYQQLIIGGAVAFFVAVVLFMLIAFTRRKPVPVEVTVNQATPITV